MWEKKREKVKKKKRSNQAIKNWSNVAAATWVVILCAVSMENFGFVMERKWERQERALLVFGFQKVLNVINESVSDRSSSKDIFKIIVNGEN